MLNVCTALNHRDKINKNKNYKIVKTQFDSLYAKMAKKKTKSKNQSAFTDATRANLPSKTGKESKPKRKVKRNRVSIYEKALFDPFSSSSWGVRIPDIYSFPTETFVWQRNIKLVTDAGGNADFMLLPNCVLTAASTRNSLANGVAWTLRDGSVRPHSRLDMDINVLSTRYAKYRVVAGGCKVNIISSVDNTYGELTVAKVPYEGFVNVSSRNIDQAGTVAPIVNGVNSIEADPKQTMFAQLKQMGVPIWNGTLDLDRLSYLTGGVRVPLLNVSDFGMEIHPKPISDRYYEFLPLNTELGYDYLPGATGSYEMNGRVNKGMETILLGITGAKPETVIASIDVIYHLEGIAIPPPAEPNVAYASNDAVVVDIGSMYSSLKKFANSADYAYWGNAALNVMRYLSQKNNTSRRLLTN